MTVQEAANQLAEAVVALAKAIADVDDTSAARLTQIEEDLNNIESRIEEIDSSDWQSKIDDRIDNINSKLSDASSALARTDRGMAERDPRPSRSMSMLTQEQADDFKRRWVEALRSGKSLQATEMLANNVSVYDAELEEYADKGVGHCCLGVGMKIEGSDLQEDSENHEGTMPNRQWCADRGLKWPDGQNLAENNDDMLDDGDTHRYDFNAIADQIEGLELVPYSIDAPDGTA